jgi:ubiquinone/menaquinone biosynthesis C-methylase UbiE
MCSPVLNDCIRSMTEAVRRGGTAIDNEGTLGPDHPVWVKFARGMAPLMMMPAQMIPKLVDPNADRKLRVLDIAAGHGLFGIAFATNNKQAEITAVDWKAVLEVAKENAQKAGVSDRYQTIEGSAFDVDFGSDYDVILLTNFLHHFDPPTCETLLRKVRAALADGGRAVTLEFVPNEDRVTPPDAAGFSMQMLIGTPSGDAYTFSELERMFANAGFSRSTIHPLPPTIQQVVISEK